MKENWIIPCNLKIFNLIEHFATNNRVVWRNAFSIHEGDTVYIYIGSPISEIRYRCKVLTTQVDSKTLEENSYAISKKKFNNYYSKREKYIIMEKECEYKEGCLPLADLRAHGLGQVQLQARIDRNVLRFIEQKAPMSEVVTNA